MELRIDGSTFDLESDAEKRAAERAIGKLEEGRDAERARADKAEGRLDGASTALEALKKENADLKEKLDGLCLSAAKEAGSRVAPHADFGKAESPRQVWETALRALDPTLRFDGRDDRYVEARFDFAIEQLRPNPALELRAGRPDAAPVTRTDGSKRGVAQAAYEAMQERNRNAWRKPARQEA